MTILPGPSNAIVYANFILQGRWRRILSVAFVYGALIAGAIYLSSVGSYHPRDLRGWVVGLTVLQLLNLFVFGAFRVESAVRADVTSRMLESHRLMPAPALSSILGYLFGAPLQAWVLAVVNFILGAVCCSVSSMDLNLWALLNGATLLTAVWVYSMLTQFSFIARGGFLILIISGIFCISTLANGGLEMFPSLNVLLFPLLSRASIFVVMFDSSQLRLRGDLPVGYIISFAAMAAFTALSIRVAMRRYVSSSMLGISPPIGLLLLTVWVMLAIAQVLGGHIFFFTRIFYYQYNAEVGHREMATQTIAALCTSCLVALLSIASAARTTAEWRRNGDLSQPKPNRVWSTPVTLLVAAGIVCSLLLQLPAHIEGSLANDSRTVLIVVNFLVGSGLLFTWGYLIRRRAWIFVCFWVFLTWAGPVLADGVYRAMNDIDSSATAMTAFSPAGALSLLWSDSPIQLKAGIAGQVVSTLLPAALLFFTRQRIARRSVSRTAAGAR